MRGERRKGSEGSYRRASGNKRRTIGTIATKAPSIHVRAAAKAAKVAKPGLALAASVGKKLPMSLLLDSYRKNAEAARLEAERSALPNVRARAIDVAACWTEMAEQLEWVEEQGRIRTGAVVTRMKP